VYEDLKKINDIIKNNDLLNSIRFINIKNLSKYENIDEEFNYNVEEKEFQNSKYKILSCNLKHIETIEEDVEEEIEENMSEEEIKLYSDSLEILEDYYIKRGYVIKNTQKFKYDENKIIEIKDILFDLNIKKEELISFNSYMLNYKKYDNLNYDEKLSKSSFNKSYMKNKILDFLEYDKRILKIIDKLKIEEKEIITLNILNELGVKNRRTFSNICIHYKYIKEIISNYEKEYLFKVINEMLLNNDLITIKSVAKQSKISSKDLSKYNEVKTFILSNKNNYKKNEGNKNGN
jgi:hypothetical protein